MKVLYVLPRYHTNMLNTVKGWQNHGDEVHMICLLKGSIEADEYVKPYYVGFSCFYLICEWIYINLLHRNNPSARNLFIRYGVPPMGKVRRRIREINPDLVIVRERSLSTVFVYAFCRVKGYKTILYTQDPLYVDKNAIKMDVAHRLLRRLTPSVRITPCFYGRGCNPDKKMDNNAIFAPFVAEPKLTPDEKTYFQGGNINILEIGKYVERKNHFLLVKAIERLVPEHPDIRLNILGEVDDDYAREYYTKLKNNINKKHLDRHIQLLMNYSREQVAELYKQSDLFILASTDEPASVSILEAMSFCVPAISGSDNGTADYILPGVTGEIFEDCNLEDLIAKIESIIIDRDNLPKMGKAAYNRVCDNFVFKNYYDAVMEAASII